MKNKKIIKVIAIIIFLITIDQLSKNCLTNSQIEIIPNFLSLKYLENTGIAFGINLNMNSIILLNIIIIICLIWIIKKVYKTKYLNPILFILAGGIGNVIDRIAKGHVTDFIDVNLFNFPTFNIADVYIVVGILILIIQNLKELKNQPKG